MGKIYDALKKAEKEAQQNKHIDPLLEKSIPNSGREIYMDNNPVRATRGNTTRVKKSISSFFDHIKQRGNRIRSGESGEHLFILNDPHSYMAEQYRSVKSHIFTVNRTKPLRTVLITSALPNEGKTITALNLSVCISQGIDQHVLLVDADLRKPNLHQFFGLNLNGGLSQFLAHQKELQKFLVKTDIDKLTLLPSGQPLENPSELLATKKMSEFIKEVKSRYNNRLIIFDSSPIQATVEPRILAELVDGIILVVAAGQSDRTTVEECVKKIGKDKILGIILNKSQEKQARYIYNTYYAKKQ